MECSVTFTINCMWFLTKMMIRTELANPLKNSKCWITLYVNIKFYKNTNTNVNKKVLATVKRFYDNDTLWCGRKINSGHFRSNVFVFKLTNVLEIISQPIFIFMEYINWYWSSNTFKLSKLSTILLTEYSFL